MPLIVAHSGISVSAHVETSVSSARTPVRVQAKMEMESAILPVLIIVENLMIVVVLRVGEVWNNAGCG